MQGHVRFITDHPTVVARRRDVEYASGSEHDGFSVFHRRGSGSRKHQTKVFDFAEPRASQRPNMFRPSPARLIGSSSNAEPSDVDHLKAAFFELANFVGFFKFAQDYFEHRLSPSGIEH